MRRQRWKAAREALIPAAAAPAAAWLACLQLRRLPPDILLEVKERLAGAQGVRHRAASFRLLDRAVPAKRSTVRWGQLARWREENKLRRRRRRDCPPAACGPMQAPARLPCPSGALE